MAFVDRMKMKKRLKIEALLTFESGWRVGSGREGMAGSDLGLLRNSQGLPTLPGTSLKGRLRSTCESLAHALDQAACCLDSLASGVDCISDVKNYFPAVNAQYQSRRTFDGRMQWLEQHTCDVCKLFGSPLHASRIRVSEGVLKENSVSSVQVRDSVVLDRDSHTAVDGLKYDYEVSQAGTEFEIEIELQDASDQELALIGAALMDWSDGVSVGGFTSRGLGRAKFAVSRLLSVDFTNANQRLQWLMGRTINERYQQETDWQGFFIEKFTTRPIGNKK